MSEAERPYRPEHPNPLIWWKHLRRMAYLSIFNLTAMAAALYLDRIPEHLEDFAASLAFTFGMIVLAYLGSNVGEMFARRGK